ncbi:sensor domain-containing protein [Selenihalanaerobacter shriftii]|uniref:PAS domain S-box-containing protein/diguanylate cyclase (GGDEF) domain-containing protein n=1 Tax=Selenihalanaerobacter shriftii TaxID=142842 RepID=A0A1T4PBZ9_9FIRM|nr:GGDEF domain-containing phosphodiesterase [Selenihalanaerobacter shriftii]SJZ89105.1 PAS domain S-box-containing protein/diguanylate cyclase (GGDEF) domain-containing protein [Selenihalanaerobacter shriftii]
MKYKEYKRSIISAVITFILIIGFNVVHYFIAEEVELMEILLEIGFGVVLGVIIWWGSLQYDKFKLSSQRLKDYQKQLEHILNNVEAIIWSIDLKEDKVFISEDCKDKCGLTYRAFIDASDFWKKIIHPDDLELINKQSDELLSGETINVEHRIKDSNREVHWVKTSITPSLDSNNEMYKLDGIMVDITKRKQMEEKITHMAYHDSLTNLPNRNLLNEELNKLLKEAKNNQEKLAIIFLDLDRFKLVNDTIGHDAGDLVLKKAAKRLIECTREDDIVSRFGGDEFVIIMKEIERKQVKKVVNRIIREFSKPLNINEYEIIITPSIGISVYPEDGNNVDELIRYADIAMYSNKNEKKVDYKFYDSNLNVILLQKAKIENRLRNAIENNELRLHYQPQVNLNTGEVIGVEALIRWQNSELGHVSPGEFIPIAEESGLIKPIGKWVLQTACKQNKAWQDAGLPPMNMSVNVSRSQLFNKGFLNTVNQVIERTQLDPKYLELEITESSRNDIEELISMLKQLKEIGFKIALDDFGTGYSSLSILDDIPLDNLKIDRSFIQDISKDKNKTALVKNIINIGNDLNLNIIAEGIETTEQHNFLKQNNCNIGQGYLFERPVSGEKIEQLLNVNKVS